MNPNDQQYINVIADQALAGAISRKGQDTPKFLKRDEVLKRIRAHMQNWYEIRKEGRDAVQTYVNDPSCPHLRACPIC